MTKILVKAPLYQQLNQLLRSLISFTDKARAAGKIPSTQVLKYQVLQAEEAGVDLTQIFSLKGVFL
jgi:DNA-binding GntR family transcriptional regulator